MIQSLARHHISQAVKSWRLFTVLAISALLIIIQEHTAFRSVWSLPNIKRNFLNHMLLFNQFGSGTQLYLFSIPFIASLLGGSLYAEERYSKRLLEILVRTNKSTFLFSCLLDGFLLGGIGGTLPIVLNLIVALIREPHMEFIDGVQHSVYSIPMISSDSWIYDLYRHSQIMVLVFSIFYIFILSGLLADLSICISVYIKNKYVEIPIPFVLSFLLWIVTDYTPFEGISFMNFLDLRAADSPCCLLGVYTTIPFLAIIVFIVYKVQNHHEIL